MSIFKSIFCIVLLILGTGCATKPTVQAPSLDEVVLMSKQNIPAEEIIKRMRASNAVYHLSASQYAQLHKQGVPDSVLNYMQSTYINDVRRGESRTGVFGGVWGGSRGSGVGVGIGF